MRTFRQALSDSHFLFTAEIIPPRGVLTKRFREKARLYREAAPDAVNVTDNHVARVSLSPIVASTILKEEGLEPIWHMTLRDRNRLALQTDLLSATYFALKNLLIISGDDPIIGNQPEAKGVYDITSAQAIEMVRAVERGADWAGARLSGRFSFVVGAAFKPTSEYADQQFHVVEEKMKAGVDFFQTQIVFDPSVFEKFRPLFRGSGVKVLAGIMPMLSAEQAHYMNAHVPGVHVPDKVIAALERADDPHAEGVAIAKDLIRGLRSVVDGVHIMAMRDGVDLVELREACQS
jgi:5,10-methylenetetrahydrofolate reductase